MLVLTRKAGERIHIGDNIWLEVRRIQDSRVSIAISAPDEIRIFRGELLNGNCAKIHPAYERTDDMGDC